MFSIIVTYMLTGDKIILNIIGLLTGKTRLL